MTDQTLIHRLSKRLGHARASLRQHQRVVQELRRQLQEKQGHLDQCNERYWALENKRNHAQMDMPHG